MAKTPETPDSGRRDFLKLATAAAPAAAVAATLGTATEAEAAPAKGAGLQDTDHTRAYYASARF